MDGFEEKLGAILSNQDAMSQIMALAKSLGGGEAPPSAAPALESSGEAPQAAPSGEAPQAAPSGEAPQAAPSGEAPPDGGLDPRLLSMAAKLAGAYSDAGDDRRAQLLQALRPFVREERRAKLDKAIQIARLTRVARIALDSFRAKGDGNV